MNKLFRQRIDIQVDSSLKGLEVVQHVLSVLSTMREYCDTHFADVPNTQRSFDINLEFSTNPLKSKRVDFTLNRRGWTAFFVNHDPQFARSKTYPSGHVSTIYWSKRQSKFEQKMMGYLEQFVDTGVLP